MTSAQIGSSASPVVFVNRAGGTHLSCRGRFQAGHEQQLLATLQAEKSSAEGRSVGLSRSDLRRWLRRRRTCRVVLKFPVSEEMQWDFLSNACLMRIIKSPPAWSGIYRRSACRTLLKALVATEYPVTYLPTPAFWPTVPRYPCPWSNQAFHGRYLARGCGALPRGRHRGRWKEWTDEGTSRH